MKKTKLGDLIPAIFALPSVVVLTHHLVTLPEIAHLHTIKLVVISIIVSSFAVGVVSGRLSSLNDDNEEQ